MDESQHIEFNEGKWDKLANSLERKGWRSDYLRKAQRGVISLLDIKENSNFLDIGCGTGWALGQVAELIDGKGSFYGVDLSTKMIEKGKSLYKGRDNFHFIKSNAESIPLDDNVFDTIICTNSFHHYFNPDKAMKEIYRLLKVKGKIYILDPTADFWLITVIEKLIKLFEPDHVKLYSTQEFKRFIVGAGLQYVGSEIITAHQKVHIGEK